MIEIAPFLDAVDRHYGNGSSAYWLPPTVAWRDGSPLGRVQSGDSVIFCCRRGEREIQLTEAFTDPSFTHFPRRHLHPLTFVPLVLYHSRFDDLPVAYRSPVIEETLGHVVSRAGLRQFRLAEEEKSSHVTYFLNGRRDAALPGLTAHTVPSYLDEPLKALPALTEALQSGLSDLDPELAVVNVASGDLLGHNEDLGVKQACAEAVDDALGRILKSAARMKYTVFLTADHGLLEEHGVPGGPANTSHTTHPVPFAGVMPDGQSIPVKQAGTLADVAPTILETLGLEVPSCMTGTSLLLDRAFRSDRVLLVILDGWGLPEAGHVNPIAMANTPVWDRMEAAHMGGLIASGTAVGLPESRKGNSESGHITIGAGQAVLQDEVIINKAIREGRFVQAEAFQQAFEDAASRGGAVHLLGLLSKTSSHGSIDYALQLLRHATAIGFESTYLHVITDGRSTRSKRLPNDLEQLAGQMKGLKTQGIVTLVGRGIALDRGGSYETKTRIAYDALVEGTGEQACCDSL